MAGKIDIKNVVAKRSGSNGTAPKISLPSGVPRCFKIVRLSRFFEMSEITNNSFKPQ